MLTEFLRALAPVMKTDLFIGVVAGGLLLWALLSGLRLKAAVLKFRLSLQLAGSDLTQSVDAIAFSEVFEAAGAKLAANPLLGSAWKRYRATLVVPSTAGRPVLASAAPHPWFDLTGLLRAAGADPRYHAALPGLLVGAGLLVTFFGLAVALSSAGAVVAEGVSQAERNAALRDLLGAASVKFVTSVVGLLLSIGYALFRKYQVKNAEKALATFLSDLQDRIPLTTPVILQVEANAILARQYTDIQRIGNDFFVNLGSTLEREFGNGLEQHLAPLASAVEQLSARLAHQNEDALQTMLQAFLQKLEGAVGESMSATTATLDKLGNRLDGLQGAMDAAAGRMSQAAEEMATRLGRGAETALGGITEQMGALVRTLREAAEEAGQRNRHAGDEMIRQMADTAAALTGAAASLQQRMEDGATQGLHRLIEPIEGLLRQLRDLAESQRRAGAESTTALAATIERAAQSLEATAARAAATLDGGATDLSARLLAATETMRDSLRDMVTQLGSAFGEGGAQLTAGATAGGESLRLAAAAMGGDLATTAAQLRDAGEAAGTALREGGHRAGAELGLAARGLAESSDGLGHRLAGLGDVSAMLVRQVEALDQALRGATGPLLTGAADLRAGAEAARAALSPWRETTEALRMVVDSTMAAAAAMEAAQTGAARLADRLGATSERFAGIDVELKSTLDGLGTALHGYQRQVAEFFTQMDSGLARSINGLNAVAKDLQDAAEEITDPRRKRA